MTSNRILPQLYLSMSLKGNTKSGPKVGMDTAEVLDSALLDERRCIAQMPSDIVHETLLAVFFEHFLPELARLREVVIVGSVVTSNFTLRRIDVLQEL